MYNFLKLRTSVFWCIATLIILNAQCSLISDFVHFRMPLEPTVLPHARITARQFNGNRPQNGGGGGFTNNRPFGNIGQGQGGGNRPSRPSGGSSSGSSSGGPSASESAPGNSDPAASLFTRIPPLPIPPLGLGALGGFPGGGGAGAGPGFGEQGLDVIPFGFDEFILIMVPQFKIKVKTPEWWGADIKFSFPITVFFDKLVIPESGPPLAFFPFGPIRPVHRNKFKKEKDKDKETEGEEDAEERANRVKRGAASKPILSLPPPEANRGGERATVIPKMERMLDSYGIPGRACILRTVCEVHSNELHKSYGLLGEVLTLLFKVSRSSYALSHLPDYHEAEMAGKARNCEMYEQQCEYSILTDE